MSRFDLRKREKVRMASVAAVSSLAVLAVLAASPGEASAYFTAYDTARWEQGLALGSQTEITEEYEDGVKTVVITNTGETECFVRVKVFKGSQIDLTIAGDGWKEEKADGYWYYQEILPPKAGENSKTKPLTITVNLSKAPVGGGDGDAPTYDQNVVVIEECAQVFYRDNADGTGQEPYADWNLSISATGEGVGV